jgi:hypothetical protein
MCSSCTVDARLWRRLHGHGWVILTTMFREDYAATLVDRSAAVDSTSSCPV